jgi:hypothetical protein
VATPQVDVVGLRALARDITRASAPGGALDAAMTQAGEQVMSPIASQTRAAVPRRSGRLAASVRVAQSLMGATVSMGGDDVAYAGPVEFGGWPEGRQYLSSGRYLFPAFEPLPGQAIPAYTAALQRALDSINWTNQTTNAESVHD